MPGATISLNAGMFALTAGTALPDAPAAQRTHMNKLWFCWVLFLMPGLLADCLRTDCHVADASCDPLAILLLEPYRTLVPRFVYVANTDSGGSILTYSIDRFTGILTQAASLTIDSNPYHVSIAPDGRFLYAPAFGANLLDVLSIDQATGALALVGSVGTGTNPTGSAVHPSGNFVYAVNNTSPFWVFAYQRNQSTGQLSYNGQTSVGNLARYIEVHQNGLYAYVTETGVPSVSAFTINQSNGVLSANGSVATGANVDGLALDPGGKNLYTANFVGGDVSMMSINEGNGTLGSLGTIGAGAQPYYVVVAPSGLFVYALNQGGATITIYSRSTGSGLLTATGDTAMTGGTPAEAQIDPTGKFMYVTNNAGTVSMYAVDTTTGALAFLGTVPAGAAPNGLAILSLYQ